MSEIPAESREAQPDPTWAEKVTLLHTTLDQQDIPYAFGGAIALNYHREPRATLDIDVNVFLPPEREHEVMTALAALYDLGDASQLEADLLAHGQTRSLWNDTYVDLFFANTDFHTSMAQRVTREPFGDIHINVLSIEDLLVCKLLFDRPKDWLDIDAVVKTRREQLDLAYTRHWLEQFVDSDDARFQRLDDIIRANPDA